MTTALVQTRTSDIRASAAQVWQALTEPHLPEAGRPLFDVPGAG